jgi:hypothetical protein
VFIKEFKNTKIFTKKDIQNNSFKVFTNTFLENERKLQIDQTNFPLEGNGIYPNCLIFLKKHNLFVSGSSTNNKPYHLKFLRFYEDIENQMQIDFKICIPLKRPITRLVSDSKETHLILAFNNDANCCLEIKKRSKKKKLIEEEPIDDFCFDLENKNDLLNVKSDHSNNIDKLPVIRHLWTETTGFYYKAIDFIRIDINRLTRNKYWKKNITKSGLKELEKLKKQYLKNKTGKKLIIRI